MSDRSTIPVGEPTDDNSPFPTWAMAAGALVLWALYFAVAYSPVGSMFVYATF